MKQRTLISFDWALKRLLRSKANFDILEGFLSELLHDDVTIMEVLEGESNKASFDDKFNRVDLKVKNIRHEIILIELQFERELDYLHRLLYSTAKTITEHMTEGTTYDNVVKIIFISILHFDLGQGTDYIYLGNTTFKGMHTHDILDLSEGQKALFQRNSVAAIFPEYYLIKVKSFDDVARDTLDEWIYFLKNSDIRDDFTARGIKKAKEKLSILQLPEAERKAYERYQDDLRDQASFVLSTYGAGKWEGLKEGRQEGAAAILLKLLRRKFGEMPGWAVEKVTAADSEHIEKWSENVLFASSLDEVFSS